MGEGPYRRSARGRREPEYELNAAKLLLLVGLGAGAGLVVRWWVWSWECAVAPWPMQSMPSALHTLASAGLWVSGTLAVVGPILLGVELLDSRSAIRRALREPLIRRVDEGDE